MLAAAVGLVMCVPQAPPPHQDRAGPPNSLQCTVINHQPQHKHTTTRKVTRGPGEHVGDQKSAPWVCDQYRVGSGSGFSSYQVSVQHPRVNMMFGHAATMRFGTLQRYNVRLRSPAVSCKPATKPTCPIAASQNTCTAALSLQRYVYQLQECWYFC